MDKETINKIYDMLSSQRFFDWYGSTFEDHITGEEDAKSTEEIKDDIRRML